MAGNFNSKTIRMTPEEIKKRGFFFGTSPDIPKVVELDIHLVSPNPDQPRKVFDEEKIQELASSIERDGLLSPIIVKKQSEGEGYIIVAGERRFRAHQILNKETIFAFITKSNNPDELALIENLQRENLNPIEEAAALSRLMETHGYTHEELGKVVGKARNTITSILKLNLLPEAIKQECPMSDRISKSLLIEIAQLPTEEERLQFWEGIKQGNHTVKTVREAKKGTKKDVKRPSATEQMLSLGRSFVRKLRRMDARRLADNKDQLDELLALRQEIYDLIEKLDRG